MTSLVDVRQAEQLVYGATGEIATLERQIEQQENFISVLLGGNPGPVARGRRLTDQPHAADVPAGLPSEPARAASRHSAGRAAARRRQRADRRRTRRVLPATSRSPGRADSRAPRCRRSSPAPMRSGPERCRCGQPVFTAGRTRSQVALAEARRRRRRSPIEQTIRRRFAKYPTRWSATARRANSATSRRCCSGRRRTRGASPRYATRAARPATSRCSTPIRGYSTRSWASSQAQLAELSALVEIYRALGGGWQT